MRLSASGEPSCRSPKNLKKSAAASSRGPRSSGARQRRCPQDHRHPGPLLPRPKAAPLSGRRVQAHLNPRGPRRACDGPDHAVRRYDEDGAPVRGQPPDRLLRGIRAGPARKRVTQETPLICPAAGIPRTGKGPDRDEDPELPAVCDRAPSGYRLRQVRGGAVSGSPTGEFRTGATKPGHLPLPGAGEDRPGQRTSDVSGH